MSPPGSGLPPPFGAVRAAGERHPGWPAVLGPVDVGGEPLLLRPLRRADGADWRALRIRDRALLEPWGRHLRPGLGRQTHPHRLAAAPDLAELRCPIG